MTIALWCVLIAGLLPYVSVGISKVLGGRYNNNDPRGHAESYTGLPKRAHAAHLNAFEAFPFFAAAVIVAEIKGGPSGTVNMLAMIYIAARIGYLAFYLTDRATLRSLAWAIGMLCVVAIFTSPLWR